MLGPHRLCSCGNVCFSRHQILDKHSRTILAVVILFLNHMTLFHFHRNTILLLRRKTQWMGRKVSKFSVFITPWVRPSQVFEGCMHTKSGALVFNSTAHNFRVLNGLRNQGNRRKTEKSKKCVWKRPISSHPRESEHWVLGERSKRAEGWRERSVFKMV